MIDERVQTFLGRLKGLKGSGKVLRMPVVTNAFSSGQFPHLTTRAKDLDIAARLLLTSTQM